MAAPMRSIELLGFADGAAGGTPAVYGLYGLIGIVATAVIAGAVTLINTRWTTAKPNRRTERIAKEREAFERFILLNTAADPRLIKTGYEHLAEVARVPT